MERKRERIDRELAVTSDIIQALDSLQSWRAIRRVMFTVMMRRWPTMARLIIANHAVELDEALRMT